MSIESSIDRLAAAIEKLASAVAAPVVVAQPEPAPAQPVVIADLTEAPKKRGRPKKQGNIEIISQEGVTVTTQPLVPVDPPSATQTADTATTTQVGSTTTATSVPVAAQPETSVEQESASANMTALTTSETTTGSAETISKADIVKILTGLQKTLEDRAQSIEEKRAAAQKCRDLIKSVVGSESLKDAKPEHFGKIKSAVLKVLNNE